MAIKKNWNLRSEHVENVIKFVHITHSLGRKRVAPSNGMDVPSLSSPFRIPPRTKRGRRVHRDRVNRLESLPEDVLVRVLCKVDHSDLKQLLLVSHYVKDAALVAREMHFNFSTPICKRAFKQYDSANLDSEEPPNKPMQRRAGRSIIDGDKLGSLAVTLFASP